MKLLAYFYELITRHCLQRLGVLILILVLVNDIAWLKRKHQLYNHLQSDLVKLNQTQLTITQSLNQANNNQAILSSTDSLFTYISSLASTHSLSLLSVRTEENKKTKFIHLSLHGRFIPIIKFINTLTSRSDSIQIINLKLLNSPNAYLVAQLSIAVANA